ncbi:MAG: hypothetical protein WA914_02360 [Candidatus Macondimonas sp.]
MDLFSCRGLLQLRNICLSMEDAHERTGARENARGVQGRMIHFAKWGGESKRNTAKLALNDWAQAKAMAAVCLKECDDCAQECRKPAKQHAICEEMAKSCEETVAAARRFIG